MLGSSIGRACLFVELTSGIMYSSGRQFYSIFSNSMRLADAVGTPSERSGISTPEATLSVVTIGLPPFSKYFRSRIEPADLDKPVSEYGFQLDLSNHFEVFSLPR